MSNYLMKELFHACCFSFASLCEVLGMAQVAKVVVRILQLMISKACGKGI